MNWGIGTKIENDYGGLKYTSLVKKVMQFLDAQKSGVKMAPQRNFLGKWSLL